MGVGETLMGYPRQQELLMQRIGIGFVLGVSALAAGWLAIGVRPSTQPAQVIVGEVTRAGGDVDEPAGELDFDRPEARRCAWKLGQNLAFDVSMRADLTFDETALLPTSAAARRGQGKGDTRRTQSVTGNGRLEARVLSVTTSGEAVVALKLSSWQGDLAEVQQFPDIERDMRLPYLLRVDPRCRILASARPKSASVIAYRRLIGIFDRMDFALPPDGASVNRPYTLLQLDDFGKYTSRNHFRADATRGRIERERVAYAATEATRTSLPLEIKIRSAGGIVHLGESVWFESIVDSEEIDTVSRGKVPFSSKASTRIDEVDADANAFRDVRIVMADFVWGRPTEAELDRAHEMARSGNLAGLPPDEALNQFLATRESGKPGAWHDAQRLMRDWMRANPDGVRDVAQMLGDGHFGVSDQADLVLALAKSGSPEARAELEGLVRGSSFDRDLRVQAASACADLIEPTTTTVSVLNEVSAGPRSGTSDDILASTATMSIGTIVYNVPSSRAADAGRQILHKRLQSSDTIDKVEALHAASNTGDPTFLAAAGAAAASEVPEERAAGAHSLRKMIPSESTEEVLNTLLREDVHPDVVKGAAEARREQLQTYGGDLDVRELALYETKLSTAPEGVRWELLRTLGEASKMQPEAKAILVDWFPYESAQSLRVVIGQYVAADDLVRK